jgi:hypothetical protein
MRRLTPEDLMSLRRSLRSSLRKEISWRNAISVRLSLRESCIREKCTCSLSGGRRLARERASSDPTAEFLKEAFVSFPPILQA